ncbi:MAG: glycosyltransferase family 2 protein, partial [Rhodobacteraceae bacterium]|nr:glycosyltransferase family 2 protein [Paracoccaceae bacterium]
MSKSETYLEPILQGRTRVKYVMAAILWAMAAGFFWAWWLQPAHIIGTGRYLLATACIGWIFFLQAFFILVLLNGRRSIAPAPMPGQWRVAMIVTKTPGEPLEVVQQTLRAMLAQDYPHDTWL